MRRHLWILYALLLVTPLSALAEEAAWQSSEGYEETGIGSRDGRLLFEGRMQNLFLWRNDRDFDRTAPYYNEQGQDSGVLGTFIAPRLEIRPTRELRIVWETEVGLNLWSANDADQYDTASDSSFRMAIRQLYTEGRFFDGTLGFRAGYEQLFDPSGLFLGHWLGAANLSGHFRWGSVTLTAAQVPDQTYEGVNYDTNNFNSDTFVYGARLELPVDLVTWTFSAWGMHDTQVVRQPLDLGVFTAQLMGDFEDMKFIIDANLQVGNTQGRAANGDELTIAWSAQGTLDWRVRLDYKLAFLLRLNTLFLSGDDDHDGNDFNGAWFYSGKSRSRTLLLTEDELRDRGGNLDERLAERRQGDEGKFYVIRPGLSVSDITLGLDAFGFFRPQVTVGTAFVLNPENALGNRFVGVETDLHVEFYFKEFLSFDVVGSALFPGKAASALVNASANRLATDPIGQVEAVLTLWF